MTEQNPNQPSLWAVAAMLAATLIIVGGAAVALFIDRRQSALSGIVLVVTLPVLIGVLLVIRSVSGRGR